MGVTIGMPSLKLNNAGKKSKSCGDFKSVAEEGLDRHGKDKDIDTSRADLNEYIGFQSAEELIAYSNQHIEELNASLREQGKKGIRSDAVVMCATIIKPPAHWINSLPVEEQNRFIYDAIDGVKTIIPEENIKSIAIHRDELGLHAHFYWEPMTADGRLSAKECHNLKFFGRLNREMPAFLRERGWNIDDCKSYDAVEEQKIREELGEEKYAEHKQEQRRNRGVSSAQFKAEAEEQKNALEQKIDDLDFFYDRKLLQYEDEIDSYEMTIKSMDALIDQKQAKLEELNKSCIEVEKRLDDANTRLQGIRGMIEQAEKYYHVIRDGLRACEDLKGLISFVRDLAGVLKDREGMEMASQSEEKRLGLAQRIKAATNEYRTTGAEKTSKQNGFDR